MKRMLIWLLRLYQRTISPDHGWFSHGRTIPRCRFYPTCSSYAIESVQKHGAVRGGWRALKRLARCHPWNPGGIDEV